MFKDKIKTVFMGTPDFGIPSLRAIITDPFFDAIGVVTQPDKKTGRKQILTPPPIKEEALKHGIPVLQPEKISLSDIRELRPDIIIVAAYAQILPEEILDFPRYGCINIHASLLPYCRGASCIQYPIIEGKKETGVTIMKMDKGLDTGPILAQKSIPIEDTDTTGSLFEKLSTLGAKLLIPVLKDYIEGKIKPVEQGKSGMSCVRTLKKEDGRIDFLKAAAEIERFVRAMTPWPGAYAQVKSQKSKVLKIIKVKHEILEIDKYKPGELFVYNGDLAIRCGKNALIIKEIQPEGKKTMAGREFINGYGQFIGSVLEYNTSC